MSVMGMAAESEGLLCDLVDWDSQLALDSATPASNCTLEAWPRRTCLWSVVDGRLAGGSGGGGGG